MHAHTHMHTCTHMINYRNCQWYCICALGCCMNIECKFSVPVQYTPASTFNPQPLPLLTFISLTGLPLLSYPICTHDFIYLTFWNGSSSLNMIFPQLQPFSYKWQYFLLYSCSVSLFMYNPFSLSTPLLLDTTVGSTI